MSKGSIARSIPDRFERPLGKEIDELTGEKGDVIPRSYRGHNHGGQDHRHRRKIITLMVDQ